MEAIYSCLEYEFQDIPFSSMNVKPSYYLKNGKNGYENIVTLTVNLYDKFHSILGKHIYRFINDNYKVSAKRPLKFITVENLEESFRNARNDISNLIYHNYYQKYNKCISKLHNLENYVSCNYDQLDLEENNNFDPLNPI